MGSKLNSLLQAHPKNGLLFSSWLKEHGYSNQLVEKYRSSGWLNALCRGVMYRRGEKLSAFKSLQSYNEQIGEQFRIAGLSALEVWGYNHYVPMGKPILLVATKQGKMPPWMKYDVFDYTFNLFTTKVFPKPQTTTKEHLDSKVLISVPEQAFMECLILTPSKYDYVDLYMIMEQLTNLRPSVVQFILEETKHFKAKRLFLYMAEKAGHYWINELDCSKIDIGTHKLQLAKSGVYVNKYKMVIPKELYSYD